MLPTKGAAADYDFQTSCLAPRWLRFGFVIFHWLYMAVTQDLGVDYYLCSCQGVDLVFVQEIEHLNGQQKNPHQEKLRF